MDIVNEIGAWATIILIVFLIFFIPFKVGQALDAAKINKCLEIEEPRRYTIKSNVCERFDGDGWVIVYGKHNWHYNELGEGVGQ